MARLFATLLTSPALRRRAGLAATISLLPAFTANSAIPTPYPRSDVITGIVFQKETLVRKAPGSDIWSCAWAENNTIYAAWGDGGGFGGDDEKGRASIGVAALTGNPPDWNGLNVWGGFEPLSKQTPTVGKGTIAAVGNLLYLYVSEQGKWARCKLWKSADYGMSWQDLGWLFPESHKAFAFPGIIDFGRGQQRNPDGFIYGFSDNDTHRIQDKRLYLFRVRSKGMEHLKNYEYFCGSPEKPNWTRDYSRKTPVFQNEAGISWGTTCVFHPATRRFLLAVTVHENPGDWGLYESEHPWGPWKTVAYQGDLPDWTYLPAEKARPAYLHTFPSKWMAADGKTLWCVYDRGDHFNLVRCTLQTAH